MSLQLVSLNANFIEDDPHQKYLILFIAFKKKKRSV